MLKFAARRRALVILAGAACLVGVVAGVAYATIPNSGVINGCYTKSGGTLRVIDASVTNCTKTETALAWNVQGAQGIQGTQGIQGAQGIQGTQGPAGVSGWQLVSVQVTVDQDDDALFSELVNPLTCPAGKKVLGGGVTPNFSSAQGPRLEYSGPAANGTRWDARLFNTTAFDDMVVTGWVICASVG